MTVEPEESQEFLLGVVIPVKEIHPQALSTLRSIAESAPALEFVAVGKVTSSIDEMPNNLRIVDEDCSIYEAMNEGTLRSQSNYLLYMGIDDFLLAENVVTVLSELPKKENADMIVLPFRVGTRLVRQAFVGKVSSFHHQGVLFRRTAVLEAGGYSSAYQLHSDLDLMFRLQSQGVVNNVRTPLVAFSKGGATTSGRYAALSTREISEIYFAHNVGRLSFNFMFSIALLCFYRVRWMVRRLFW